MNSNDYDHPLDSVQIVWGPNTDEDLPPVELVKFPFEDDDRYENSWGASNLEFANATSSEKMEMLLAQFAYISVVDKISPVDIHRAFWLIPEYREALGKVGFKQELGDPKC